MNGVVFGLLLFLYYFEMIASREWFTCIHSRFSVHFIVLKEQDEGNVQKNRSIGASEYFIDTGDTSILGEISESTELISDGNGFISSRNTSTRNVNTNEVVPKTSKLKVRDWIPLPVVVSNVTQTSPGPSNESGVPGVAPNVSQTSPVHSYISSVSSVSSDEALSYMVTSSMPQTTSIPMNMTHTLRDISCDSVMSVVGSNVSVACFRNSDTRQRSIIVSSVAPQSFAIANKSQLCRTNTSLLKGESEPSSNHITSSVLHPHSTISSHLNNRFQTETSTRLWSEAQLFNLPLRNLFNMTYLLKKYLPLTVPSYVLAPDSQSLSSIVKNHKRRLVQKCRGHDIYSFCQGHSLLSWDSDSHYFYTFSPQPLPSNHSSPQLTFVAHTS